MSWPSPWAGRWIWWEAPPAAGRPADGFGYLRRGFTLETVPASLRCRLTANGRYILWVNGHEVGRGPVRSEPAYLSYDDYDIASLVHPGANAVAVLARHYGGPTTWWKPASPMGALGFGCMVFEARSGDDLVMASDADWRALPAPYRRPSRPRGGGTAIDEAVDGAQVPRGWTAADFDDSGWDHAVIADPAGIAIESPYPPTEPFGELPPRPISQMAERVVTPVRIVGRGTFGGAAHDWPIEDHRAGITSGSVVDEEAGELRLQPGTWATLDLGGIVLAHPRIRIDAESGAVIDLVAGEDFGADGDAVAAPRDWTLRYTATGGTEEYEAFEAVGFRYLRVGVREGGVRSVDVTARERHYPRPAGASFSCDDPGLTAIWAAGARTLDLCSTDAYLDCPGREQRAWLGDAYVHTLVSLVANPDLGLALWNMRLHAQGARADGLLPMVAAGDLSETPTTIPDYSLHWIRTLARLYEHTGDPTDAERLMPVALRALEWFERRRADNGLIGNLTSWLFIDWAQTERGLHTAAIDGLYAMALDDAAMLATAVNDDGVAARLTARADLTREAFAHYWDAERGVYVDAADATGPRRRVSQQTNAVAILSGAAPRERWDGMLDAVLDADRLVRTHTPADVEVRDLRLREQWRTPEGFDEETNVVLAQPFFAHFLHQALIDAGRLPDLVTSIRRWEAVVARGNGCVEEYWTAPSGGGSRCHAWSATPTYDLSTHVLGVHRRSPGWTAAHIEPFVDSLGLVAGSVPTPLGFITVEAAPERVTVHLPKGCTGTLVHAGRSIEIGPGESVLPA